MALCVMATPMPPKQERTAFPACSISRSRVSSATTQVIDCLGDFSASACEIQAATAADHRAVAAVAQVKGAAAAVV